MNRLLILSLFCFMFFACRHDEQEGMLPHFECLTTADGLQSDHVLHILQLPDGRMAFTSDSCINLYDGRSIVQHPVRPHDVFPIPNYTGAYHVYADHNGGLWVKEWGNVWRMNLETGQYTDLSNTAMRDIFVDSQHECWVVGDSVVQDESGSSFRLPRLPLMPRSADDADNSDTLHLQPALQDLDADSLRLYLFYSNGCVVCYDRRTCQQDYVTQAYDSTEMHSYDATSLVVRSAADSLFYQLRCGRQRYIFLQFNPVTQVWRTLFETKTGVFHSLVITKDGRLALLGCPQGVWEINLENGRMNLHSELTTTKGDTLRTGVNGLVCDRSGGLWLATYDNGVLHAPTLHDSRAYIIYIIVAAMAVVVACISLAFLLFAAQMRRRERQLMERIKELVESDIPLLTSEEDLDHTVQTESSVQVGDSERDNMEVPDSFVSQAAALVEKNLLTPDYGVEQLAADLCMERTGLYKKLTAALNQTPTLFIRSIRMERAARLLREGNMTIAEIAKQCGFQSPGYFSRIFQQVFGMKPSEYVNNS